MYWLNLGCVRVRNCGFVNPLCRFLVFRILDLLGRINWWLEIFKNATLLFALAVNENFVSVIGTEVTLRSTNRQKEGLYILKNECVQVGQLFNGRTRRNLEVLFFKSTSL